MVFRRQLLQVPHATVVTAIAKCPACIPWFCAAAAVCDVLWGVHCSMSVMCYEECIALCLSCAMRYIALYLSCAMRSALLSVCDVCYEECIALSLWCAMRSALLSVCHVLWGVFCFVCNVLWGVLCFVCNVLWGVLCSLSGRYCIHSVVGRLASAGPERRYGKQIRIS